MQNRTVRCKWRQILSPFFARYFIIFSLLAPFFRRRRFANYVAIKMLICQKEFDLLRATMFCAALCKVPEQRSSPECCTMSVLC